MNKKQKEVELAKLRDEKKVLAALKKQYEEAAKDVQAKIRIHDDRIKVDMKGLENWDDLDAETKSIVQSQIYQKKFQEQLKAQIDETVKKLNAGQYDSIEAYLNDTYTTSAVGTARDLHDQGVPLITPIDKKAMLKSVELDPKLSNKLYGSYMEQMKDNIRAEVSRGIATADSYEHIARNISNRTNQAFNKTMRIVRTEGHRIQMEAAYEQQQKAKKAGADIVKQWDATLDGRTRPTHRKLDGQIRDIDDYFEVNGHKAKYPSGFGRPEEDINCRCTLLQRAKWALDDEELEILKERAEYFKLDKTEDFEDFKKKYLKAAATGAAGATLAHFMFKKAPNAKNTTKEQLTVMNAVASTPQKVVNAMQNTTVEVGGAGSAYDYANDIMYIAAGATTEEVHHEIGHLIDSKLLDVEKVSELKEKLFKDAVFSDIIIKTMHKTNGEPVTVIIVKNDSLVSEYQGRIYVDNIEDAFDRDGKLRTDRLLEFASEPYRAYMEDPEGFKEKHADYYALLKGVIEDESEE